MLSYILIKKLKTLIIGMLICLELRSTSMARNNKLDVEKLSANKREGCELDLSGQELTDQDMLVVIQYAFENSTVSM